MRILVVTSYYKPAFVYGGPTRSNAALCEGLSRIGHHVTVLTTTANGAADLPFPLGQAQYVDGVEVHYFPRSFSGALPMFFYSPELGVECRRIAASHDLAFIDATWTYPLLAAARDCCRHGVPYFVSPRGSFMKAAMQHGAYKKAVYLRLFERKLIDRAAGLHFTSALEREESSQLGFQSRSFVVPNASVMLKDVGTTRGAFRRELGIPPDSALTIVVGRNHYLKRLELALQAFRLLSRDNRNAHLAFIGPACDSPAMSRQIFDLGLTGRVHLCGLVSAEKLAEVYTDADLLAMLSLRENFGNVVIEAAARGVPALLSKHVGLAEEITAAGAGVIVEDDPHQIAESWNRMLVCDSRACMSAAARKFAEAFTPERIASNMVREFTTATTGKSAGN